jgi:hypothetical protein
MASMPCGSLLAQSEIISFGPFELLKMDNMPQTDFEFFNYPVEQEKSFIALGFDDNLYNLNVISNAWKSLDCSIKFRLEDDLPYENMQYDYNGFFYFDFSFDYKIKAFNVSIGIENLLGINDKTFDIEPVLENRIGVYDEIIFSHESNTMIKLAIAYNF